MPTCAVQAALDAAVEQYAYAKELFEQWQTQGAKDANEIDAAVKGLCEAKTRLMSERCPEGSVT